VPHELVVGIKVRQVVEYHQRVEESDAGQQEKLGETGDHAEPCLAFYRRRCMAGTLCGSSGKMVLMPARRGEKIRSQLVDILYFFCL
jgi:hypothetical protein